MAIFGSIPSPWNFWWARESTQNQVATLQTAPSSGTVTSITCFVAGDSGTSSPWPIVFAIWNASTGALIGQSSSYTGMGSGSSSSGGQSWVTLAVSATITGGVPYYIGWWHGTLVSVQWSSNTSVANSWWQTAASISNFSGSSTSDSIGAYATYTTGGGGHNVYLNGTQETVMDINSSGVTLVELNGVAI